MIKGPQPFAKCAAVTPAAGGLYALSDNFLQRKASHASSHSVHGELGAKSDG